MAKIHDLTDDFKAAGIAWGRSGQAFLSQFSDAVRALRLGLYATMYANTSPYPILDRNGDGRTIVLGDGNTLKYGKFEGGVAQRQKENHRHMHRVRRDGRKDANIFSESLRLLLVLDLSEIELGPDLKSPGVFEPCQFAGSWGQPFAGSWGQGDGLNDRHQGCPESGF